MTVVVFLVEHARVVFAQDVAHLLEVSKRGQLVCPTANQTDGNVLDVLQIVLWWCRLAVELNVLLFTVIIVLELLGEHKLAEMIDALEAGTSWEVAKVGFKS